MYPETDPDREWVAHLAGTDLASADRAVAAAGRRTELYRHLAREHARAGRDSYVEIDAPLELHALVRLLRPRHVVEVGVSSGVSSAYLLDALAMNRRGTLHSVDLPRRTKTRHRSSWSLPPGRATGWAIPARLKDRFDLRLGDKANELPRLAEELDRIDLFVYDVPHNDRTSPVEFRALDPRMPEGAVAIVDHGPGGELCAALRRWGRDRGARAVRRRGLGLFGVRLGPPMA